MHKKYDFDSSTPFVDVFNKEELEELYRLDRARTNAYFMNGIPDAPFEKNWHELAMKRMLRYAAENGYDAVAWTNGEQQAERYGIAKVVKDIYVAPSDVERYISIKTISGDAIEVPTEPNSDVIVSGDYKGQRLSDVVGKELADKILSVPEGSEERIAGDDLKVGGEGMKGFYDKMLPAFMNKYGKKWGIKVADITLPNVEEAGRVMHSVPVTDAMKESVMEGQVMFMKRPNGKVFGWTDGKKIYLTKAGMNPNTKIHEYTHLWAKAMMQKNPKGWNSIKQLLKNTPVWNEVMNDVNYSNIHNNEDMVASEVISRLSGTKNAAKLEQMAQQMIDEAKGTMRKAEARGLIQNIKDALNKFWSWVGKNLFEIENFNSIDEITDRVLWDLVNKTDLQLDTLSESQVEAQIEARAAESDELFFRSEPITISKANDKSGSDIESDGSLDNVYFEGDLLFRLNKSTRQTISKWLDKREDLSNEVKESVLDYLDQFDDTTLQLAMGKWFTQNSIRLPEDTEKCMQAIASAKKAKVDALQFSSPMEIINQYGVVESKKKPINPDNVSTLKKAK
jgi:hypothetical protein